MRRFLQSVHYIFHPLLVPLAGSVAYFLIAPYSAPEKIRGNLVPIFILTVVIPLLSLLIYKNFSLLGAKKFTAIKELRYFLYINILLLLLVVYKIIPKSFSIELHYYFMGIIAASLATIPLLLLNFKSSVALTGMGSFLMYLICLSVHFEKNITMALGFQILATGLVATSALYRNANNKPELLIGLVIGMTSQLLTVKFWL